MNMKAIAAALVLLLGSAALTGVAQQIVTKPVVPIEPQQAAQSPPPTPPAATMATDALDPNYVIGPGYSLEVNVFNEPKFSGSLPVRPDGMISITLIGDLLAAGLTPMQLGDEITSRLKKLITDPNVTVSVLGINS